MSWMSLGGAVYDRLTGDTGSGGLFETDGAAEIGAVYVNQAERDADFSGQGYITINPVSFTTDDVFESAKEVRTHGWQADVYTAKAGIQTPATYHEAVVERAITRLRRTALTVSGWVVSENFLESSQPAQVEDDFIRTTLDFVTTMSK